MQTLQFPSVRAPSRLSHNKENIDTYNFPQTKRTVSLQNQSTKQKHNYDIYFPKSAVKKIPFLDQPENYEAASGLTLIKPNKSLSVQPSCAKTLVESVKKRLTTKEAQKNEEIQKRRKNSIGAVAYIPTTLEQLKTVIKRR